MYKDILSRVDHTLLSVTATWEEIAEVCQDAIKYNTASVCIPPSFVKKAKKLVGDKIPVCTVIGFPNGYNTTDVKVFEAADAIKNGADEIDMVINQGMVKEKAFSQITEEIKQVKQVCGDKILKVIIETCNLSNEEKIRLCKCVTNAGADYIKTSTGFGSCGATKIDVELLAKNVGENVKVKAAGGISSIEDAKDFIELGADRLGTSRIVKILKKDNTPTNY